MVSLGIVLLIFDSFGLILGITIGFSLLGTFTGAFTSIRLELGTLLLLLLLGIPFFERLVGFLISGCTFLPDRAFNHLRYVLFAMFDCATCLAKNIVGSALKASQSVNHIGLLPAILSCHHPIPSRSL